LALRSGLVAVHIAIVKQKKKQKKQAKNGDVYAKTSTWPKSNVDIKTSIVLPADSEIELREDVPDTQEDKLRLLEDESE